MLGWIHYNLPGVFLHNVFSRTVNLSLWTIPLEFICYFLMAGLMAAGLAKKPWVVTFFAVLLLVTPIVFAFLGLAHSGDQSRPAGLASTEGSFFLYEADKYLFKTSLIPAYLFGVLIYYFRYYIPFSPIIIGGLSLTLLAVGLFGDPVWELNYTFQAVFIPTAAYLTVLLGLTTLPRLPFFNRGDYSYGIYLYGFPLQQCLIATFRSLNNPILHFLATVPLATAVASLSWHFVEKPILKQRKRFSLVGRRIAVQDNLRSQQKESAAPVSRPLMAAMPVATSE
jgi:peptidoglycan/LPS O-acetylase OafA/YrhL